MLSAVFEVYFIFYQLVSPEYHAGVYLPHKEIVGGWLAAGHILLHREIKGEPSDGVVS